MATTFTDVTVGFGGEILASRHHDTSQWPTESTVAMEQAWHVVRAESWNGPLEGVLDVPDDLPWLSWRRSGPDASFVCQSSDGLPWTYSLLISGRGHGDRHLIESLSALPFGPDRITEPAPPDALVLADLDARPLLATRPSGHPATAEQMQACAQVETVLAAAFFSVLRVR
jgi:hypothetical protein